MPDAATQTDFDEVKALKTFILVLKTEIDQLRSRLVHALDHIDRITPPV